MRYAFDVDDTLCRTEGTDYAGAQPIPHRIRDVNELFDEGHTIIIHTARGQLQSDRAQILYDTESQLKAWGVKYHVFTTKPAADIYVDDRAQTPEQFFGEAEG